MADADSDENPERVTALSDELFPFTLKRGGSSLSVLIRNWDDVCRFAFEGDETGESMLGRFRSWYVRETGKPAALSSLTAPEIQPYLTMHGLACAKFNHAPVLPGTLQDYPQVLVEAFALIESEVAIFERHARQIAKREMNQPPRNPDGLH